MKNIHQKGFSAIIVLLILILIAVIGFTGYYVWDTQKSKNKQTTQNAQTNTESPNVVNSQEQTEVAKPTDAQKYLVIKEWGVKIPAQNEVISDYIYFMEDSHNGVEQIGLSTTKLSNITCKDSGEKINNFIVGRLYRTKSIDDLANATNGKSTLLQPVKIGEYNYIYWGGSGYGNMCNTDQSVADLIQETRKNFEDINKTLIAN